MDKLELFNELIKVISPHSITQAEALDWPLSDADLDSLDSLMMGIYLSDIYGVSEEILKTFQPVTIQDVFNFMEEHKTKELPATIKEALDMVK